MKGRDSFFLVAENKIGVGGGGAGGGESVRKGSFSNFLDEGVVLPLYPYSWKPCFPGPPPFLWILSSSIRLPGPNKVHSK